MVLICGFRNLNSQNLENNNNDTIIILDNRSNDVIYIHKKPCFLRMRGGINCEKKHIMGVKIMMDTTQIIFQGLMEHDIDSIIPKKLPQKIKFGSNKNDYWSSALYKNLFALEGVSLFKQIDDTNELVVTYLNEERTKMSGYMILDMYNFGSRIINKNKFIDNLCHDKDEDYYNIIHKVRVKYIFNYIPCDIWKYN